MTHQCIGKRRYKNQQHAIVVAEQVLAKRATKVRPYYCGICLGYHLSKQPSMLERILGPESVAIIDYNKPLPETVAEREAELNALRSRMSILDQQQAPVAERRLISRRINDLRLATLPPNGHQIALLQAEASKIKEREKTERMRIDVEERRRSHQAFDNQFRMTAREFLSHDIYDQIHTITCAMLENID